MPQSLHSVVPALVLAALSLTACQADSELATTQAAATPTQSGEDFRSPAECNLLGQPTIVRYRSALETSLEHSVHLLNPTNTRPPEHCGAPPLAGEVTLRYQVAKG